MKAKIKGAPNHGKLDTDNNCLELLKEIKGIAFRFESQQYLYLALDDAKTECYAYKQGHYQSNSDYLLKFKATVNVIEHFDGKMGEDDALVKEELKLAGIDRTSYQDDLNNVDDTVRKEKTVLAKEKMCAIAFVKQANTTRYGQLIINLENNYTRGVNQYPATVTSAYNLLVNYKRPINTHKQRAKTQRGETNGGGGKGNDNKNAQGGDYGNKQDVTFVQDIDEIRCFKCNKLGHYAATCTEKTSTDVQMSLRAAENDADLGIDFNFCFCHVTTPKHRQQNSTIQTPPNKRTSIMLSQAHMINQDWILLDSQSTVNLFKQTFPEEHPTLQIQQGLASAQ